jgi:ubiquinone/menaquinone biosynthesis C-methylase UbiE
MEIALTIKRTLDLTIESVADYWNRRPCNVRHSQLPVGTREYFDAVEERKYFIEPHIPEFAEFSLWKDKKVLEIGCGIGTDTINFARSGAHVTAVDISEKSLEIAKQRAEVFGLGPNISFLQGNAEHLTDFVEVTNYDLVYSFGVIHHTPCPKNVVEEIKRFMSDDTMLKLMVYAKNSWKRVMIDAGFDQPEAQRGCPIAYTYSENEVRQLLDGFVVEDIQQRHIFPYVVDKYVMYEYELEPWFKVMPKRMFNALEESLGWHLLINARRQCI